MKLLVHSDNPVKLRDAIENYLKSDESIWLYIDDYKTNVGTTRPVFTHKSKNYKDKAKFVVYAQSDSNRVLFYFTDKESSQVEAQYMGMLIPLIMNNFPNNFTSISVEK
ncbi:hypothetical protein LF887_12860 [Chryseobacterium sp. MEBOG06]|uniref:hypothetical protein n=1 Tax=Chryseobacterium sp. MEBOG06 TaxID=2879938 RepID=UPI001F1D7837|nr:hypothetical protein [Chryseobacterium sp. MEBOG06]UKB81903.1 hypothetical protein LF887_12860 [Chryseobacterium sp. MEBOG06]